MHSFIRTLFIWLLMLALPIQGMAAAGGTSCDHVHDVHEASAATLMFAHSHADAPVAPDRHGHHAQDVGAHHHDAGNNDDIAAHEHHATASTCSACSACCFGAAIPASALNLAPAPDSIIAVFATPPALLAGHIPDGPKRPPRSLLV